MFTSSASGCWRSSVNPVRLARSTGFSPRELRGIQRVVAENETALQEAWNEYFAD